MSVDIAPLVLRAPLSGPLVPLDAVPDPVFAKRMVGDGISIDPVSDHVWAPCDGTVTHIHPSEHAITLQSESGLEVLIHVGVDTVSLSGQGFSPQVRSGDAVRTGDLLMTFDMDYVATNAKSLLTQVIITNAGDGAAFTYEEGLAEARVNTVLTVTAERESQDESTDGYHPILSDPIAIANPSGLHARPAAVLAHEAKQFKSHIEVCCGDKRANAKSTTAIMKLQIQCHQTVILRAQGPDGEAAIAALITAICDGLGEDTVSNIANEEDGGDLPKSFSGLTAAPGFAIGTIHTLKKESFIVDEYGAGEPVEEKAILAFAIKRATEDLETLEAQSTEGEIFAAHRELLADPEVLALAEESIARGKSAGYAWQIAYTQQVDSLASLSGPLFAARAIDMRDVGERALRIILGVEAAQHDLPETCILVADDLTPSQTAALDPDRVRGFCTVKGGTSSHVAILAQAMKLPALVGIAEQALSIPQGTRAILDTAKGTLSIDPSDAEITAIETIQEARQAKEEEDLKHCHEPAMTTDNQRIRVLVNAGNETDNILAQGGEGVGLLRSEFLFQKRASMPSEEEQFEAYREAALSLGNEHPVVIRTLDVGGDKPLSYVPIAKEENPFLGERGIRVALARPELLHTQIRAILRASSIGNLSIMFPMVTTLAEYRQARAIVEEEALDLEVNTVRTGIMVEVPAVAAMAKQFAEEVDFFSIGTNDLSQYTMAVDRGHGKLAQLADGLHPGMLALLANTADVIKPFPEKYVSVCGALAADPVAIPILLGLGIQTLSVPAPAVAGVKALIRTLDLTLCREIAIKALGLSSAAEVRELVTATFPTSLQ